MAFDIVLYKIEELRRQMERMALLKGSLTDPEVIAISQQLDKLLNHYDNLRYYCNGEQCVNY